MIQPGTKVTITIEATVMQAYEGQAVHVMYGDGNESYLIIKPHDIGQGVTIA